MMSLEIAKTLIETPVETLIDMEEEPDIQIIRLISRDLNTLVEFDARLIPEGKDQGGSLRVAKNLTG